MLILGGNSKRNGFFRKIAIGFMIAMFVANLILSVSGSRLNAELNVGFFPFSPAALEPISGQIILFFGCAFLSLLVWLIVRTFVTNPFAIGIILEQIFRVDAQGFIKILFMIANLAILGIIATFAFYAYKFDLTTTQFGLGLTTLNPLNNPVAILAWSFVFGPEITDIVLTANERLEEQTGGGVSTKAIGGGFNGPGLP